MALIKKLIPESKYSTKCPYLMSPKGVCIHNTANDAPAKNEATYMTNNNMEVSFHIAVDDVEAIQLIPFNRNAWAAGDGGNGNGNRNYIHLEICYSKSGGERFIKAEQRAAKEVALLLKQYGWRIDRVKKHQDFSAKYCPHRTLDMGWQRFLNMIQAELNLLNKINIPEVKEAIKVDYIIQYSNSTDQAIAEIMADRLNCPTINCLRPYAYYGQYKTVIAVGEAKNRSGYTNVLIQGKDRADTLNKAIEYCEKLGK